MIKDKGKLQKKKKIKNKKDLQEYLEEIFDVDWEDIQSFIEYIYEHEGD